MKREAIEAWRRPDLAPARLGTPRNIAVLHASGLGELLRALRTAVPQARVTLVGLPETRELAERFRRYVDDFLELPGFPGLRACDAHVFAAFLRSAHEARFDVALQLQDDGRVTNALAALLGAPRCAGYVARDAYCPDPERFLTWQEGEHEVLRPLRLLEWLGVPDAGIDLEFPIHEGDRSEFRRLAGAHKLHGGRYVCVHPGARSAARRWPPEHFAQVADALAAAGHRIVLLGMPGEAALTCALATAMRAHAIDLTGKTSLGGLAVLLARSRLLIGNDTGVAQLAAALRTPSVVLSRAAEAAQRAPLDAKRHRLLCADPVEPEQALRAALEVLLEFPGDASHRRQPIERQAQPALALAYGHTESSPI